jgi:hypothetical protein
MKTYARIMVAITFLFGLGVAANAETHLYVAVTLPFGFVACKTTLPAGKYIVARISEQPFDALMLTRADTSPIMFMTSALPLRRRRSNGRRNQAYG